MFPYEHAIFAMTERNTAPPLNTTPKLQYHYMIVG